MDQNTNLLPLELAESLPKQQRKRTKSMTIIFIVLIIGILTGLIIYFMIRKQTESGSSRRLNIEWCYDVTLGQSIDATGLEHGVLNKYVKGNLTHYQQGMYRRDFDVEYNYNGRDPETVQSYNTLIEQSRFVNIFAEAYARTNDSLFLEAMWFGIDELFTAYHDDAYGGYFWQIQKDLNGSYSMIEDYKESESTAFLIKALATVYKVTLNETILEKATDVYWYLIDNFTDQTGVGLREKFTRNFSVDLSVGRSVMQHEFHAFGKLYEAYLIYGEDAQMEQELFTRINDMYDLLMTLRVNATFNQSNSNTKYSDGITYLILPTSYTTNWTFSPSTLHPQYKGMNIGVNFEVALWMSQMMDLGVIPNNETNQQNINEIFNICADLGWNETSGIIEGASASTFWWIGIEAIRTISYYYFRFGDKQYLRYNEREMETLLDDALKGYIGNYYDSAYGGVFFDPFKDNFVKGYGPGGWTKVAYHLSESCFDVLRYSGFVF